MFTVNEIAELGFKKFSVSEYASKESCMKKIREIIKDRDIKAIDKKRTPGAKRTASAYSVEVKDNMINDWLFDYLIALTKDEEVGKYLKSPKYYEEKATEANGKYEDENLDFLNLPLEQKEQLVHNEGNSIKRVTKHSKEFIERKNEIMLEALFTKFYSFNSDELVEDFNKADEINYFKQGNYSKGDIRVLKKFSEWEKYVEEKQI